jgi:hypothetical protein
VARRGHRRPLCRRANGLVPRLHGRGVCFTWFNGVTVDRCKIRNSLSETRNRSEYRSSKFESPMPSAIWAFGFPTCLGFRISDFEFLPVRRDPGCKGSLPAGGTWGRRPRHTRGGWLLRCTLLPPYNNVTGAGGGRILHRPAVPPPWPRSVPCFRVTPRGEWSSPAGRQPLGPAGLEDSPRGVNLGACARQQPGRKA